MFHFPPVDDAQSVEIADNPSTIHCVMSVVYVFFPARGEV